MKKIAILLTLLCTIMLNCMEQPELNIEALSLEAQDHIITALNTYDDLDDIIYAIRALSITSKTFKAIIDEKYGSPEKLKKLASTLSWNFETKAEKCLNDYKTIHAHAYEAIDIWERYARPSLYDWGEWLINSPLTEEEVFLMYSNYENALVIKDLAPQVPNLPIWYIIEQFKTPGARQYPGMLVAQKLLVTYWSCFSYDIIKKFIDEGIEINYCNSNGTTPLLHVLKTGPADKVIQLLLESGANPHAKDKDNNGVFEYLDLGYPQTCQVYTILKQKVKKLLEDALEKYPLHESEI